ncbi:MAG: TlpA disulfide reductase family protein [Archangium sp.]
MKRAHLAVALALLAVGCAQRNTKPSLDSPSAARAKFGDAALELELQAYPGLAPWKLSSLRGKVILLDVWATWCDPCRESLPLYEDMAKEYAARGFEVVAVSVDENPELIPTFMADTKVKLPVVVDPSAKVVGDKLKVSQLPTAFLIDRKGVVRVVHEGFDEALFSTWLQEIEGLLKEEP